MKILVKVKAVDFSIETDEDRKLLEQAVAAAVRQVTGPIEKRVTALATRVEGFKLAAKHAEDEIAALLAEQIDLTVQVQNREPFQVAPPRVLKAPREAAGRATESAPSEGLDGAQQKILDVIAMLEVRGIEPNKDCVARWIPPSGIHPRGGSYGQNLGYLRANGYLDGLQLTDVGRAAVRVMPTGLAAAKEVLEGPQGAILDVLEAHVGKQFSKDALAEALGIHPRGGSYGQNLGRLRTMGLIPERGDIYLTEGATR